MVAKVEAEVAPKAAEATNRVKARVVRKEAKETDPFLVVVVRPELVDILREAVDSVAG